MSQQAFLNQMNKENKSIYFIEENVSPVNKVVDIVSKKTDKVIFKTILQTVNEVNRNNKLYTKESIDSGLTQMIEEMKARNFVGELDHPQTYDELRLSKVLYRESSHMITEYWWKNNELWATVETLYTEQGRNMSGLIRDGVKVGFSLRAFGGIEDHGDYQVVTPPIFLVAYDCVSKPSHKISRIQEITQESQNKIILENANLNCKDGVCRYTNVVDYKIEMALDKVKSLFR